MPADVAPHLNLHNSQLAIIPNTTHYSLIDSPLLTEVATAFLTQ